jgi:hypothetical protein
MQLEEQATRTTIHSFSQNADAHQAFIGPFRPTVFGSRLDP